MINKKAVNTKLESAVGILNSSIGKNGIFAGSGTRYKHQYWTRDMALALVPALNIISNSRFRFRSADISDIIQTHLNSLTKLQGRGGAIPILFSDFSELLLTKMRKCSWDGNRLDVSKSFVLKRIFDGWFNETGQNPEFEDFCKNEERGLYRLTPGTTDSELLFAYAVLNEYGPCEAVRRAVDYLEKHYVLNGLHHGADWRDTMEKFFRNKSLLSNNAILYAVYKAMGEYVKAEALKQRIDETFWTGETYLDYPNSPRLDPLGTSLAVIHGLVPPERYGAVIAGLRTVDSPFGVTIECKHNAYQAGEKEVINRTGGVVVWPFVVGFTVIALSIIDKKFAHEQFTKMHYLDGFAEWYDPANGQKWEEYEQGWSAALYILAAHKLMPELFE